MTYCVGMMLDRGLVLMSDTRTNSGVDNISTFRKMYHWQVPGERVIAVMTAGNLATTQRDRRLREPQIALRRIAWLVLNPVRRVHPAVLRTDRPHTVLQDRHRVRPPDPLGDHRRGHVRGRDQQLPHRRLERRDRRRHRRPLVPRWPLRGHSPRDRRPSDTQVPGDLTLRNTIRHQPPDQSPILHRDHPSNLSGWPHFRPSLWPHFRASSTHAPETTNRGADGVHTPRGD